MILSAYLERLSKLAGSVITCGPVLNWFELDNRGNRLVVTGGGGGAGGGVDGFEVVGGINTPAVAAAYAVKSHAKKASDEISFEVGKSKSISSLVKTRNYGPSGLRCSLRLQGGYYSYFE